MFCRVLIAHWSKKLSRTRFFLRSCRFKDWGSSPRLIGEYPQFCWSTSSIWAIFPLWPLNLKWWIPYQVFVSNHHHVLVTTKCQCESRNHCHGRLLAQGCAGRRILIMWYWLSLWHWVLHLKFLITDTETLKIQTLRSHFPYKFGLHSWRASHFSCLGPGSMHSSF